MPASAAKNLTARPRNARFSRGPVGPDGTAARWSRKARPRRRPALLHPGAARRNDPGRGHDRSRPVYPWVLDELVLSALHTVERHANNLIEADHGRL